MKMMIENKLYTIESQNSTLKNIGKNIYYLTGPRGALYSLIVKHNDALVFADEKFKRVSYPKNFLILGDA